MTVVVAAGAPTIPVVIADVSVTLSGIGLDFGSVLEAAAVLPPKTAAIAAPVEALEPVASGLPAVPVAGEALPLLAPPADVPVAVITAETASPAQSSAPTHVERAKRPTMLPGEDLPLPPVLAPTPSPLPAIAAVSVPGMATLIADVRQPTPDAPSTTVPDVSSPAHDAPAAGGAAASTAAPLLTFSATPEMAVAAVVSSKSSIAAAAPDRPEPLSVPLRPREVPTIDAVLPSLRAPPVRPAMSVPELPGGTSGEQAEPRPAPVRDDRAQPPPQSKPGTTPLQPWALAAVTLAPLQHAPEIRSSTAAQAQAAAPVLQSDNLQDTPGIALRIDTPALGFVAVQFAATHPQPDRLHVHFVVERATIAELIVIGREGLDRVLAGSGAKIDGVSVATGTGSPSAGPQGSTTFDSSSRSPRRDQRATEKRQRIEVTLGAVPSTTRDRYA